MTAWRTRVEDAALHPSGWVALPSGVDVTRMPLVDSSTPEPLFARLTYRDALAAAAARGATLPTREQVYELTRVALARGVVLRPVTLSYGPEMVTREHAAEHDRQVAAQLLSRAPLAAMPIANVGKHWIAGATPGRARIAGWWNGTQHIQAGMSDVHDDQHHDYATTTMLIRSPRDPDYDPGPTEPEPVSLGLRLCAWLGGEYATTPHEIPGPRSDPRILAYSAACRRGGRFLGVGAPATALWDGGTPLALPSDEDAWCAACRSAALLACLLPGEQPPHGLRVSVREFVEDARSLGTLRGPEVDPAPGWAAILGRAGASPLKGGQGHVRTMIQLLDGGMAYLGIGGNESNQVSTGVHSRRDVLAWIETA